MSVPVIPDTAATPLNATTSSKNGKTHPVWLGGASAMLSVCITHPIDQTKIRSQTQHPRKSMLDTARSTVRTSNSIRGLWTGLSGSLLRQATYGSVRFGVYGALKDRDLRLGKGSSRARLAGNGAIAGILAGAIGAPAELVMVRLCADDLKPVNERLRYRNAIQGLWRIAKDEGFGRLGRGMGATVTRSVVMNATQLSCYDIIKARLLETPYFTDSVPLHLLTATLGGTVAVTACAPIDVMKSRIQANTIPGISSMSIISSSLRREGVSVLFRGWLPAWMRMTPTTMLTFVFFEQLKKVF